MWQYLAAKVDDIIIPCLSACVVQTVRQPAPVIQVSSIQSSSPALMSLLQDVLKSQSHSHELNGLSTSSRQSQPENDSDDELVGVVCLLIVDLTVKGLIFLSSHYQGHRRGRGHHHAPLHAPLHALCHPLEGVLLAWGVKRRPRVSPVTHSRHSPLKFRREFLDGLG